MSGTVAESTPGVVDPGTKELVVGADAEGTLLLLDSCVGFGWCGEIVGEGVGLSSII